MDRDPLPEVIETERLRLRPWALGDLDDILSYATDEEWARFLPVPIPYGPADGEEFLARQVLLDRKVHPSWAVVLDGSVIGGTNVRFQFEHALGEMGYSIARRHWGRGYATEAAGAVIDAAFRTHPDLERLRAMADARNTASLRVLEKVGMTKEGLLRRNRIMRDESVDEVWFGILRGEWEAGSDDPGE